MYMSDCGTCADQCRNALGRYVNHDHFRVVVLEGTGSNPRLEADAQLVRGALNELGFSGKRSEAVLGSPDRGEHASRPS